MAPPHTGGGAMLLTLVAPSNDARQVCPRTSVVRR
jgi:hypothetical protein